MGVAALVLGIVSLVISFIPFCGVLAIIPALVGAVLGIIDWVKKKKEDAPKGKAIAGTICSVVAILVIFIYWLITVALVNKAANDLDNTLKNTDWNEVFSDWNVTVDDDYDFDWDFE